MLTTAALLNEAQTRQVEKQIEFHMRCDKPFVYPTIELDRDAKLEDMVVHPGVLWPMSSKRLAAFLYQNRSMLKGKTVIDMGSGCGLQGIVAGLFGASYIVLSDLTHEAFANTRENVSRFKLESKCDVRCGDLFQNIQENADIIVFAQPYFMGKPDPRYPFTYGMFDDGDLIHRFLEQAKQRVKERIFMCHLDLAGDVNDPSVQAPKHGYTVCESTPEILTTGEQQGVFTVCDLRKN
jgi:methylase of polypeptide subunit release factors